jgi:hypothetical protein
MTYLNSDLGVKGTTIAVAICSILCFVILGCNLGRFMPSGNGTTSNSTDSDKRTSDTSVSIGALCNNEYYPVGPSGSRKYHITFPKGMGDQDYTETFSDFSGDTFVVTTDLGDVKGQVTWRCTADGLLATQYNSFLNLVKGSSRIDIKDSDGITFPTADLWKVGEKWVRRIPRNRNDDWSRRPIQRLATEM